MAPKVTDTMAQRQHRQQVLLDRALAQPGVREASEVYEAAARVYALCEANSTAHAVVITESDSSACARESVSW